MKILQKKNLQSSSSGEYFMNGSWKHVIVYPFVWGRD